ncbi:hypothetical protein Q9Q99_00265 [Curtobacterium flaccumfaciens]|nr:hypothetical protein Q9Q99_00265 [Curtobacterium flaccumfaciens]
MGDYEGIARRARRRTIWIAIGGVVAEAVVGLLLPSGDDALSRFLTVLRYALALGGLSGTGSILPSTIKLAQTMQWPVRELDRTGRRSDRRAVFAGRPIEPRDSEMAHSAFDWARSAALSMPLSLAQFLLLYAGIAGPQIPNLMSDDDSLRVKRRTAEAPSAHITVKRLHRGVKLRPCLPRPPNSSTPSVPPPTLGQRRETERGRSPDHPSTAGGSQLPDGFDDSEGRGFSGVPELGWVSGHAVPVDDDSNEAGIGLELQSVPVGSGPAVVAVRVTDDRPGRRQRLVVLYADTFHAQPRLERGCNTLRHIIRRTGERLIPDRGEHELRPRSTLRGAAVPFRLGPLGPSILSDNRRNRREDVEHILM